MILPDNIKPEDSLYYCGFQILKLLEKAKSITFDALYYLVKEKNIMSYNKLLLSLDWLFLLNAVSYETNGDIKLCL